MVNTCQQRFNRHRTRAVGAVNGDNVRARLRQDVTLMDENRFAAPDMQEAERLVADGFLAAAAGTLQ